MSYMKRHHENQENPMNTFEPGTPVWHPEKGHGIAVTSFGKPAVIYPNSLGGHTLERLLGSRGWERARIAGSDEVVVKVDDLDLSEWLYDNENIWGDSGIVVIRAAKAWAELQKDAGELAQDEQPTTAKVTLSCPKCGKEVDKWVEIFATASGSDIRMRGSFDPSTNRASHVCEPAQPDEPQEFGAKVTVNGERWLRVANGKHDWPWCNSASRNNTWPELLRRGTVTLGWDE